MTFAPGENVGAYRIVEQLGQGGMATVFKAYHAALDRFVAIKVLHPAFKQDPGFLARFTREAQIVAKLIHPNIVPVYDFSEHEGMPYLVMRYIEGQTLKARLTGEPLPIPEILDIMRPVSAALTYAHEQGILHRDIKPSNVLLTPDGGVFLTDFGLAKIAQSGDSTLSRDMMIGTPQYISPEQAEGRSDLDTRTDVYSLGVVLFEMLTGRVPFSADTPYAVVHDHIFSPLPLPTSINPAITPELERVVLKALAKERDDRYQTVGEMTTALEKAASGWREAQPEPAALAAETAEALPPPVETEAAAPKKKKKKKLKRWQWIVLGGAGLLLCFCCFLAAVNSQQKRKQAGPLPPTATAPVPPTAVPDDAVAQARAAVEADPNDARAHVALAEALAEAGQPEAAAAEYVNAGDIVAKQGILDKAADAYEEAARLAPRNVEAHVKAGIAQLRQGEPDRAAQHFGAAIELRPGAALPHAGLGVSYVLLGQLDEGYNELQQALQRDRDSPEAHFGLGLYYSKTGEKEKARQEFRFVLDSDGGDWLKAEAREALAEL